MNNTKNNSKISPQNYIIDMIKRIEHLRDKREDMNRQISKQEQDKKELERELSVLTDKMNILNTELTRNVVLRNEYNRTIQETEGAYMKILQSSQTLLHVLNRETNNLTSKKNAK